MNASVSENPKRKTLNQRTAMVKNQTRFIDSKDSLQQKLNFKNFISQQLVKPISELKSECHRLKKYQSVLKEDDRNDRIVELYLNYLIINLRLTIAKSIENKENIDYNKIIDLAVKSLSKNLSFDESTLNLNLINYKNNKDIAEKYKKKKSSNRKQFDEFIKVLRDNPHSAILQNKDSVRMSNEEYLCELLIQTDGINKTRSMKELVVRVDETSKIVGFNVRRASAKSLYKLASMVQGLVEYVEPFKIQPFQDHIITNLFRVAEYITYFVHPPAIIYITITKILLTAILPIIAKGINYLAIAIDPYSFRNEQKFVEALPNKEFNRNYQLEHYNHDFKPYENKSKNKVLESMFLHFIDDCIKHGDLDRLGKFIGQKVENNNIHLFKQNCLNDSSEYLEQFKKRILNKMKNNEEIADNYQNYFEQYNKPSYRGYCRALGDNFVLDDFLIEQIAYICQIKIEVLDHTSKRLLLPGVKEDKVSEDTLYLKKTDSNFELMNMPKVTPKNKFFKKH